MQRTRVNMIKMGITVSGLVAAVEWAAVEEEEPSWMMGAGQEGSGAALCSGEGRAWVAGGMESDGEAVQQKAGALEGW